MDMVAKYTSFTSSASQSVQDSRASCLRSVEQRLLELHNVLIACADQRLRRACHFPAQLEKLLKGDHGSESLELCSAEHQKLSKYKFFGSLVVAKMVGPTLGKCLSDKWELTLRFFEVVNNAVPVLIDIQGGKASDCNLQKLILNDKLAALCDVLQDEPTSMAVRSFFTDSFIVQSMADVISSGVLRFFGEIQSTFQAMAQFASTAVLPSTLIKADDPTMPTLAEDTQATDTAGGIEPADGLDFELLWGRFSTFFKGISMPVKLDSDKTVECDFNFLCAAGALSRYITIVNQIKFIQERVAHAPAVGDQTKDFLSLYSAKQKRDAPEVINLAEPKNVIANKLVSILPGLVGCEAWTPTNHAMFVWFSSCAKCKQFHPYVRKCMCACCLGF